MLRPEQSIHSKMGVPMTAEIFSKSYSLVQLQQLLGCWIEEYEKFEKESGWNELKFFGTVSGNEKRGASQFNYSDRIFAILHQIEKRALFNPKLDIPSTINTQRNLLPFLDISAILLKFPPFFSYI